MLISRKPVWLRAGPGKIGRKRVGARRARQAVGEAGHPLGVCWARRAPSDGSQTDLKALNNPIRRVRLPCVIIRASADLVAFDIDQSYDVHS